MTDPMKNKGGAPDFVKDLEGQLDAAKKEKTLSQIPALRHLRTVVWLFTVFSVVILPLVLVSGGSVYAQWLRVSASGFNARLAAGVALLALTSCLNLANQLCLLFAYVRFLLQFRRDHLHDIDGTIGMVRSLFAYQLVFPCAAMLAGFLLTTSPKDTLGVAAVTAFNLAMAGGLYVVIRKYTKAAQAELPGLIQAAGNTAPRGDYYAWKPVGLVVSAVSAVLLALGFGAARFSAGALPILQLQEGETLLANKEYDKALEKFNRILSTTPDWAPAHFDRGAAHFMKGQWDLAIADYTKAETLGFPVGMCRRSRGDANFNAGDFLKALDDYDKAAESAAPDVPLLHQRGITRLILGRARDAMADFRAEISLNAESVTALRGLGQACFSLKDYACSKSALERSLALVPTADSCAGLAIALQGLGQTQEALNAFRKAVELDPSFAQGARAASGKSGYFFTGDEVAAIDAMAAASGGR